jgi:hypothetical protein
MLIVGQSLAELFEMVLHLWWLPDHRVGSGLGDHRVGSHRVGSGLVAPGGVGSGRVLRFALRIQDRTAGDGSDSVAGRYQANRLSTPSNPTKSIA